MIINIILFIFLGIVLIAFACIVIPYFFGALWYPTPKKKIRKMLKLADLKPGELVYDLGCGDGRIVITAVKEFKARAVGIEIDPLKVFLCKLKIKLLKLGEEIKLVWGNLFKHSLREADVITIYLSQMANDKLISKLAEEIKEGARVVSHGFVLYDQFELVNCDLKDKIYVYKYRPPSMINRYS
jgi:cyclopropane fatty-acyl-phospholipid synthase-like methyltransferase